MRYIVRAKSVHTGQMHYLGPKNPAISEIETWPTDQNQAFIFKSRIEAKFFARLRIGVREVIALRPDSEI